MSSLRRLTAVRLKKGSKASASLKELSGTVTARVLGEAKALLSVSDVLNSAGKTVKGAEGGSIHVLAVNKERDDSYNLRLEVELPVGVVNMISHDGERLLLGGAATAQHELTLLDDKGNRVRLANIGLNTKPKRAEIHLSYLPQPEQNAPAKLVLVESKSMHVELPFKLKNVPVR
jgi:hypothetical protein